MVKLLAGTSAVLVLACGALGYFVYDLRTDLDNSKSDLVRAVDESEARMAQVAAEAVEKVPDVDEVRRNVEDLEEAIFGVTGRPMGANDELGDLRKDLLEAVSLMQRQNSLNNNYATKFCVNSGFQSLQSYSARVAAYVGIVVNGGFAARPYAPNPRCY